MIKTLRRKFVAIMMLLVSLVLLAVFVGICLYFAGDLRQQSMRALEMALDKPNGERPPSFQVGGHAPDGFNREPVFVVAVGQNGTARLRSAEGFSVDEDTLAEVVPLALESGRQTGVLQKYQLRFMVAERGGEQLIAFTTTTFEAQQLQSVALVTGLAVAGALCVFLVASVLLARWALKPAQQAWQRQRQFVADASHELKTPLTVILANVGILKNDPGKTVAQQMDWVDNTQQEAQRMRTLVEDLLFLAKADDTGAPPQLETVDLSDCVATAALAFEPVAFEQGVGLAIEVEEELAVTGNAAQLKQLVGILLDNALKYSKAGTAVALRLSKRQNSAQLAVQNQGEPIAPEDQQHLFERFYRADASRSQGGYGLGLSIAKAIAEGHKGKIALQSNTEETVFTVTLPLCHA